LRQCIDISNRMPNTKYGISNWQLRFVNNESNLKDFDEELSATFENDNEALKQCSLSLEIGKNY